MNERKRSLLCVGMMPVLGLLWLAVGTAAEPEVQPLWPDVVPGAKGTAEGDLPTLTIYLPPKEKATGTAIVICPGGGYGKVAMDHEGHQVAQRFNEFGVAGVILRYRHRNSGAGYGHPVPLQDAQRAIRTVRSRAQEWNIKPDRIGIMGFSAGGHLASTALTHYNDKVYEAQDEIDKASARPDFGILVYPVISMAAPYAHSGSVRNLLGPNPDEELLAKLSNETQVTSETPPTFLVATHEDDLVPAENSIYFYLALHKAKIPAEMHVFLEGHHGFGLGQNRGAVSLWPELCRKWMNNLGVLTE